MNEPPIGSIVRDDLGRLWQREDDQLSYWPLVDHPECGPESWYKVSGNYGPVTLVRSGYE